jgi:hypothetical protein
MQSTSYFSNIHFNNIFQQRILLPALFDVHSTQALVGAVRPFVTSGFHSCLWNTKLSSDDKCLKKTYPCLRRLATSLSTVRSKTDATNPAPRIAKTGKMLEKSTECHRGLAGGSLLGHACCFNLLMAPLRNMACKLKQRRSGD